MAAVEARLPPPPRLQDSGVYLSLGISSFVGLSVIDLRVPLTPSQGDSSVVDWMSNCQAAFLVVVPGRGPGLRVVRVLCVPRSSPFRTHPGAGWEPPRPAPG